MPYSNTIMIKIKSTLFGLLFIIGATTYGQTNKFDVGVEGSPSLISLRGNDFIDEFHESTIGFSGGFFLQYNVNKVVSLRTNIAYERKGSNVSFQISDTNGNFLGEGTNHTNLNYLILPILARATFGERIKYFLNVGPYFGYLINQTVVIKGDNIPTTRDKNMYNLKRFDTGISTGLGLSYPIKTKYALSLEIRNNLGLYNLSAVTMPNNESIKTNSVNFLLGLTYSMAPKSSNKK